MEFISLLISLGIAIGAGFWGRSMAENKNRPGTKWFWACLLSPLLGLISIGCASPLEEVSSEDFFAPKPQDTLGTIILAIGITLNVLVFIVTFAAGVMSAL